MQKTDSTPVNSEPVTLRPVVLCKDCKKYKTKFCAVDIWHIDVTIFKVKPDDYCSFGERKEKPHETPDDEKR